MRGIHLSRGDPPKPGPRAHPEAASTSTPPDEGAARTSGPSGGTSGSRSCGPDDRHGARCGMACGRCYIGHHLPQEGHGGAQRQSSKGRSTPAGGERSHPGGRPSAPWSVRQMADRDGRFGFRPYPKSRRPRRPSVQVPVGQHGQRHARRARPDRGARIVLGGVSRSLYELSAPPPGTSRTSGITPTVWWP
jgi:hypothetical protein